MLPRRRKGEKVEKELPIWELNPSESPRPVVSRAWRLKGYEKMSLPKRTTYGGAVTAQIKLALDCYGSRRVVEWAYRNIFPRIVILYMSGRPPGLPLFLPLFLPRQSYVPNMRIVYERVGSINPDSDPSIHYNPHRRGFRLSDATCFFYICSTAITSSEINLQNRHQITASSLDSCLLHPWSRRDNQAGQHYKSQAGYH